MEFSVEQKARIEKLESAGWPSALATNAVAAEGAGVKDAIESTAAFVKILSKGDDKTKALDTEVVKKRLQAGLAELAGKSDFNSIQQSITLKNAISRLNKQ
jgi:hypothetical protein